MQSKGRVKNATKVDAYGLHFRSEKIRPITYLPDFIGKYKDQSFVIECKGLLGESFPLRAKLFKHYLQRHRSKMRYYIVRNHKQVDELVNTIKNG